MKNGVFLVASATFFLGGCFGTTTIKDVNDYGTRPMVKADVVPSESQLEGQKFRVTVFDINDKQIRLGRYAEVGASVRGELVKHVSKANVAMVDHKTLPGLKTALRKKTGKYEKSAVEYALTGEVTVVNFQKEYHKLTQYTDKKGKVHITEPYCSYSALVQGNIKIHDVANNLDVVETVALSGGASRNVEVARYYRACRDLNQTEVYSLIRSAGVKAVSREDVLLKNFFSAKGYVLERRMRGKQNIFKISLGKNNGVKEDQTAEIYTVEKSNNPLTNKISLVQNKIGDGVVSNKVDKKHAWIIIDDELIANQIRLGDVVKIKYEKGFMDKLFNRSYNN